MQRSCRDVGDFARRTMKQTAATRSVAGEYSVISTTTKGVAASTQDVEDRMSWAGAHVHIQSHGRPRGGGEASHQAVGRHWRPREGQPTIKGLAAVPR